MRFHLAPQVPGLNIFNPPTTWEDWAVVLNHYTVQDYPDNEEPYYAWLNREIDRIKREATLEDMIQLWSELGEPTASRLTCKWLDALEGAVERGIREADDQLLDRMICNHWTLLEDDYYKRGRAFVYYNDQYYWLPALEEPFTNPMNHNDTIGDVGLGWFDETGGEHYYGE